MAGINKAIILGNLGRDPELAYTQNQLAVCRLAVATSDKWTDKQGQLQERTEWHNITVFGKHAENCDRYLSKGSKVYVEGKIQTDQYEKDGVTRYATKIIAQTVQFLTPGREGNRHQDRSQLDNSREPLHPSSPVAPVPPQQNQYSKEQNPAPLEFDDDVPF